LVDSLCFAISFVFLVMQKLTDTFRYECLGNDEKRTKMFGEFLVSSSVSSGPKSTDLGPEETTAFIIDLRNWLCRVMYAICYPPIDEKTASNIALTHPMAFWLFEHANQIEASIRLFIHLYPDAKDLICCVKLLDTVGRFHKYVLPEMGKQIDSMKKDLIQLYPEIYK
jgi:hypothetical protein